MIKIRNWSILLIIQIVACSGNAANFKLLWEYDQLPVSVEVQKLSGLQKSRVGEHGEFTEKVSLPKGTALKDQSISVAAGENAYFILLIKNNSAQKLKFSVAPHSTDPGQASLGFVFNCLCNGHVYDVGPHKIWYRLMSLNADKTLDQDQIVLKHVIFKVSKFK